MTEVLARRLATSGLVLLATTLVVFIVLEVLPGDPAMVMLGTSASEETLSALRLQMGLDRSAVERYLDWLVNLVRGDLGESYFFGVPVADLVSQRLSVTLPLAVFAILIATALALPLGILAASRHRGPTDLGVSALSQVGMSLPSFWLGILMIQLFAVKLGWLPAGRFPGWDTGLVNALRSLLLPATALALPQAAILTRVVRSSVLEVLRQDYIRAARARGLSPRAALWRHGVRNALIPVITILGLQFSFLVSGTIIIENVFSLPGLGRLIKQAIDQRDLLVVKNVVVVLTAMVVFVNFIVDVSYRWIDPRLRGGRRV